MLGRLFIAVIATWVTAILHPPPRVFLTIDAKGDCLEIAVLAHRDLWQEWLRMDEELLPGLDQESRALGIERSKEFIDSIGVMIDGRAREIDQVTLRTSDEIIGTHEDPVCEITFRYPLDERPRRVGLIWSRFDGVEYQGDSAVRGVIQAEEGSLIFALRPGEPEFQWHAPKTPPKSQPTSPHPLVDSSAETLPTPNRSLPLLSLSLGSLGLFFLVAALKRPRKIWGFLVSGALFTGGVFAIPFGRVDISQEGPPAAKELTIDGAFDLFEVLHRNLYRAFSADTEDGIYDLLSRSVHPIILDELYSDMYEGLILRDQGGAVCAIEKVDVTHQAILDGGIHKSEKGEDEFRMVWHWDVHGVVSHWGHAHRRVNRFEAIYTVRQDALSWKIAAVDVLSAYRVRSEDPE